jgi:hypothetical protein
MIFVFTGFAKSRAAHSNLMFLRRWGWFGKFGFNLRNPPRVHCARKTCSITFSKTRKPQFNHPSSAEHPAIEHPEMGSGSRAFNPRDMHGSYAREFYATARESQAKIGCLDRGGKRFDEHARKRFCGHIIRLGSIGGRIFQSELLSSIRLLMVFGKTKM